MAYGTISVGTGATLIVAANSSRKTLSIVNTNDVTIVYLGPDNAITTASALPLYGTQTRDTTKDYGFYLGDIYGIAGSNGIDVRYWETT